MARLAGPEGFLPRVIEPPTGVQSTGVSKAYVSAAYMSLIYTAYSAFRFKLSALGVHVPALGTWKQAGAGASARTGSGGEGATRHLPVAAKR